MESFPRLRRLVSVGGRFLIVGGISTLIEIGVFNVLLYAWHWDIVPAKIAASLVALINAYFGNREWTFRHRDRRGRTMELVLFLVTNAACTALGAALVWVGLEVLHGILGREAGPLGVNVVNLVSIAVIVVLRFLLYHWVVFRTSTPKKPAA